MRPITQILLLVVVAFIGYLLWPSSPDIKGFQPGELAELSVKTWVADKRGKGFGALMTRYKIYKSQYKFGAVPSFRIAQNEGNGIKSLKRAMPGEDGQSGGDARAENDALLAFTQKYLSIRKQTGADFDADELARQELGWRMLEKEGAPVDQIAVPMSQILAAIYGGTNVDFVDVAYDIATARSYIFSDTPPEDVTDPVADAKTLATEAYTLLKEIANTEAGTEEPTQ